MDDFRDSTWADMSFAQNYLDRADIYIVGRRKMFRYAASYFRQFFQGKRGVRVLDLGCGDGVLAEEILREDPSVTATLVDGNAGMLQKARERLSACGHADFVQATFQEILEGTAVLGEYDLCVSSMAIHHLDMAGKEALFRLIAGHLHAGGRFINIDVVLPPSEGLEAWYFMLWKDWLTYMMEHCRVRDETPDDLIRRYKDPAGPNRPDTLGRQLHALESAGFSEVDCYLKDGIFAVFGGKR